MESDYWVVRVNGELEGTMVDEVDTLDHLRLGHETFVRLTTLRKHDAIRVRWGEV